MRLEDVSPARDRSLRDAASGASSRLEARLEELPDRGIGGVRDTPPSETASIMARIDREAP